MLHEICEQNDEQQRAGQYPLTPFHCLSKPTISVADYLNRIRHYSSCSDTCFIAAVIYLDLVHVNGMVVDSLNVHRLLITAVMLASKFFDDRCHSNSIYAVIGGISLSELNGLEILMLQKLQFTLFFPPEVFERYRSAVLSQYGGDVFAAANCKLACNAPMAIASVCSGVSRAPGTIDFACVSAPPMSCEVDAVSVSTRTPSTYSPSDSDCSVPSATSSSSASSSRGITSRLL